jgi:hypothetical protein
MPVIYPAIPHNYINRYKKAFLFWIMTGLFLLTSAQDFNHYQRIQSSGTIPAEFLLSPSEKYQQNLGTNLSDQDSQKEKAQFYQESQYYINQLLLSGKVLFNDPLSNYVSKVGNHLLQNYPEIQSEVRFYVVKSPSVNAFASNSGIILVNIGLLARLENEAQLAFILCHEISHYIHQHPLEIYLKAQKLNGNQEGFMRKVPPEDILLERNNHSREKELEADHEGLNLFLRSNYNLTAIETVLDLLNSSNQTFANHDFRIEFFESGFFTFPREYFPEDLETIDFQIIPDNIDHKGHPDPQSRRDSLAVRLKAISQTKERYDWMVSQPEFYTVRQIARFENSYLFLSQKKYELAIYNSYLLLKEFPESFYLKKIITQSLYGLTKYANAGQFWDVHQSYDLNPGGIQPLLYLFEKLPVKELNIISIAYNGNLYLEIHKIKSFQLCSKIKYRSWEKTISSTLAFFLIRLPVGMTVFQKIFPTSNML